MVLPPKNWLISTLRWYPLLHQWGPFHIQTSFHIVENFLCICFFNYWFLQKNIKWSKTPRHKPLLKNLLPQKTPHSRLLYLVNDRLFLSLAMTCPGPALKVLVLMLIRRQRKKAASVSNQECLLVYCLIKKIWHIKVCMLAIFFFATMKCKEGSKLKRFRRNRI